MKGYLNEDKKSKKKKAGKRWKLAF
jgi:hypothetical protein